MPNAVNDAFEDWEASRGRLIVAERRYASALSLYTEKKAPFPRELLNEVQSLRENTEILSTAAMALLKSTGGRPSEFGTLPVQ